MNVVRDPPQTMTTRYVTLRLSNPAVFVPRNEERTRPGFLAHVIHDRGYVGRTTRRQMTLSATNEIAELVVQRNERPHICQKYFSALHSFCLSRCFSFCIFSVVQRNERSFFRLFVQYLLYSSILGGSYINDFIYSIYCFVAF